MRKEFLILALASAAAAQTTIVSGDAELRLGPREELQYFGPRKGAGVAQGEVHSERDGLRIDARYTGWDDTGVFTRETVVINTGKQAAPVPPSLAWRLPAGDYDLTYLYGGATRERQLATEPLSPGGRAFIANRGRSTNGYAAWFSLYNRRTKMRYLAQLAWSGNWELTFEGSLLVSMGLRGAPLLAPGQSLRLPTVAFTVSTGDLDDAANRLRRYQRRFVIPHTASNDPLLVQFNSWYPFPGKLVLADMKRSAEIASEIGAEVFVVDAGWFNHTNWSREIGDWQADRTAFPNGVEELSEAVRARGMKFGLWVEIENLGVDSRAFAEHHDWCLADSGTRCQLDFSRPEVRQWARAVIDRLVRDYHLEWIKIDHNINIGDRFAYGHIVSYYAWLDEVRAAYPSLVIENCASGGLRFDLGMLAHTHTTWLSDNVKPLPSLQLGYGCTVEFTPEVCNHWMVGDKERGQVDPNGAPGWWDFLFRVPMNGQFGISSRVLDWSPELRRRATENVTLYKRIRKTIQGADVYHHTPQPAPDNPTGWMAIEYAQPHTGRAVLLAYRLAKSEPRQVFQLRGIKAAPVTVQLDEEFRAAVIEVGARP